MSQVPSQPSSPSPSTDPATGLPPGYLLKPQWEMTPKALAALLKQETNRPLLLDCRRDEEFAFNRLPGAVHVEMSQVQHRADELEDETGGRTHPVIVYCHHGARSLRVTATLRALGFTNAVSLAGGIDAWSAAIDPTVPRY